MQKFNEPTKIKSEDGYTFYRLEYGKYADSLQEENVDMSWNSYDEMIDTFHREKIGYCVFFD